MYLIAANWLSSVRYQNIESLDDSNLRDSIQKTKGSFFIFFFLNGNSMPHYTTLWYIELIYINEKAFPFKCIYLFGAFENLEK